MERTDLYRAFLVVLLVGGFWLGVIAPQNMKIVSGMLISWEYGLLGSSKGFCDVYPCREVAARGAASAGKAIVYSTDITKVGQGGSFLEPGSNEFTADVIRIPCYANNCGADPETGEVAPANVKFNGYVAGFNGGKAGEQFGEVTCDTDSVTLGNGEWATVTCHFDNKVLAGKAFTIQWEASYYDEFGNFHWGVTAQPVCSSEDGVAGCTSKLLAGWTDFATGEGSSFYTQDTGKSFDQMVAESPNNPNNVGGGGGGGGATATATATTSSRSTTVTQTVTTVSGGQTITTVTTVTGIVVQENLVPWVLSDVLGDQKTWLTLVGFGIMGLCIALLVWSFRKPTEVE